jgi:hypothetical protein
MITDKINRYPDPTQHWAVLVGDYAHQLWMVSFLLMLRDTSDDSVGRRAFFENGG